LLLNPLFRLGLRWLLKAKLTLLPHLCLLCGYQANCANNLCHACQIRLPSLSNHCLQCAGKRQTHGAICDACLTTPPPFALTHALFPYQSPITQLIVGLKFKHQLSHALALGELLSERIQSNWYKNEPLPDLIIPVPLHPLRLRERGFNQALEIARPVAKTLSIPLDIHGVARLRHTAAQSGLAALERKRNIAQAFTALRDYSGLNVAVIDDVITTGHTISELCRTLKAAGAKTIHVWCCARN